MNSPIFRCAIVLCVRTLISERSLAINYRPIVVDLWAVWLFLTHISCMNSIIKSNSTPCLYFRCLLNQCPACLYQQVIDSVVSWTKTFFMQCFSFDMIDFGLPKYSRITIILGIVKEAGHETDYIFHSYSIIFNSNFDWLHIKPNITIFVI